MGYTTRRAWLATMTSREYAELRAFYNIEPFGSVRQDYNFALMGHAICKVNGQDYPLSTFIPTYEREQSIEDQFATLGGTLIPVNTDGNDQRTEHPAVDEHRAAGD